MRRLPVHSSSTRALECDRLSRMKLSHPLRQSLIDFSLECGWLPDRRIEKLVQSMAAKKSNDLLKRVLEDESIVCGRDTALAIVEACFSKNQVGLDILLASDRLVAEGSTKHLVQTNVCLSGSPDMVKQVLSDQRFAIDDKSNVAEMLEYASKNSLHDVEVFRMLLENKWCTKVLETGEALNRVTATDNVKCMRVLLDDPRVDPKKHGYSLLLTALSKRCKIETFRTLLADKRIDPSVNNNAVFKQALRTRHLAPLLVFLKDERVKPTVDDMYSILNDAITEYRDNSVVEMVLADKRFDASDKNKSTVPFASALRTKNARAIHLLFRHGVYKLDAKCKQEIQLLIELSKRNAKVYDCVMELLESRMTFCGLAQFHPTRVVLCLSHMDSIVYSDHGIARWIREKHIPVVPVVLKIVSASALSIFRNSQHTKTDNAYTAESRPLKRKVDQITKEEEDEDEEKKNECKTKLHKTDRVVDPNEDVDTDADFNVDQEAIAYLSEVANTLAEEGDVSFDVASNVVTDYIVGFSYD